MHWKKMIAPIVITVLIVLYCVFYFGVLLHLLSGPLSVLAGLILLGLVCCMIYVCVQRIHEIRSGEEDDLSQY